MKHDHKSRIVDFIFKNSRIVVLLFLFLVGFGTWSYATVERQGFPDIDVNIAMVSAGYPNASALQVEKEVLRPIENAIDAHDDVREYESTASDSFGYAVVTFDEKADLEKAIADLRADIDEIEMPENAIDPEVQSFTMTGGIGEFIVGVTGPEDPWMLYEAAEQAVVELESVDGIAEVTVKNPITPEIVVTFDSEALDEHQLVRSQIEEAIKVAKFAAPLGSITDGDKKISLGLEKRLETVADLENFIVAPDVKLKDVADVSIELNNNEYYNRIGFRDHEDYDSDLNIQRALLLNIHNEDDADILEVAERLDEKMEELRENEALEGDAEIVMLFSQAASTEMQIDEITQSMFGGWVEDFGPFGFLGFLGGGLIIVVILLLLFMNVRVAILAALAIPLSLATAITYLNLIGITLNTLVLFSMVLAIGLVVDPTIVFLESLQRHKEQGMNGRDAAHKTMKTVGLGILLAVTTNILAFVPFGIVTGFFGELIKYIPVTVIPAMIASLLIPVLFFMPVASKFLKPRKKVTQSDEAELVGVWKVAQVLKRAIVAILRPGKLRLVGRIAIVVAGLTLPFLVLAGLLSSGAVEVVQFSTPDDADAIIVQADVNEDMTFDSAVFEVAVPVQEFVAEQEEVKDFSYYEQTGNSFWLLVDLIPMSERDDDMRTALTMVDDFNDHFDAQDWDAEVFTFSDGAGPPADQYKVRVQLADKDFDVLETAATDLMAHMESIEGIKHVEINNDGAGTGGTTTFVLDNESDYASSPFLAYSKIKDRVGESELGEITIDGQVYEILSESEPVVSGTDEILDLTLLSVPDMENAVMTIDPLTGQPTIIPEMIDITVDDAVADIELQEPMIIRHMNGERYLEVRATVEDEADLMAINSDIHDYLTDDKLDELGLDKDAVTLAGEIDYIGDSFTDLFIALIVAVFLIYVLLVGFFRSFLEPFIILFAIPLGLIGVFLAVWITTGQLGFLEILGVVAMAGIVVNVTILLIDFANQMKRKGLNPSEAIATAVAVRFRPIILTQMTAFGSLIPLVIISPFWSGLASAIIFGIVTSALLSLFVTPILYLWAEKIGGSPGRFGKWVRRKGRRDKKQDGIRPMQMNAHIV